jgi:hypothetical protein
MQGHREKSKKALAPSMNWLHFSSKVPILPVFHPKQAARRPQAGCMLLADLN